MMLLLSLLGLVMPIWAAFEGVSLLGLRNAGRTLRVCLAVGLAIGVSSCTFFLWLEMFGAPGRAFSIIEPACYFVLAVICRVATRRSPLTATERPATGSGETRGIPTGLGVLFLVVLALSVVVSIVLVRQQPHGAWDAWAFWNMWARFLVRGGDRWIDIFSPQMAWARQDYPLLLPCAVARSWYYLGTESPMISAGLSLLFNFIIVGLVASALSVLRSTSQGLLAATTLLGNAYFLRHGAYQYADTPFAFFMLAAVVPLCLGDRMPTARSRLLFLVGLAAGFAAWTKNEGCLLLLAILAAQCIVVTRRQGLRSSLYQLAAIGLGLLPILCIFLYHKLHLAPASDLVAGQESHAFLARLVSPTRHSLIANYLGRSIVTFGGGLVFVLGAYAMLMRARPLVRAPPALAKVWFILALTFAGYWLVYGLTPHDLQWHLSTSARRLLLQLLPTAVFAFFCWVATPEEVLVKPAAD